MVTRAWLCAEPIDTTTGTAGPAVMFAVGRVAFTCRKPGTDPIGAAAATPVAGWPPTVTETAPTGTTGPEMNSVASPAGGFEDRKANPAWTV